VPRVIFTDPQLASVGITEKEALAKGLAVKVAQLSLEHVPRALAARDTRGLVKLVVEAGTGRFVGAHIVAPEAGEMIMEPTLAMKFGLTVEDIVSTLHPYLTLAEGVKLCAQTFEKDVMKLSCCAG
jgi:mercuric reductase